MFCPKCGNSIREGTKFCVRCGNKLEISKEVTDNSADNLYSQQNITETVENGNNAQVRDDVKAKNKSYVGVIVALSVILVLLVGAIAFFLLGGMKMFDKKTSTQEVSREVDETVTGDVNDEELRGAEAAEVTEDTGKSEEISEGADNVVDDKEDTTVEPKGGASEEVPAAAVAEESVEETDDAGSNTGRISPANKSLTGKIEDSEDDETSEYEEHEADREDPHSQYILPDSDIRKLSMRDLRGFDANDCRLARNELYARHGRRFDDEELQAYFNSRTWYEGTIDPKDFSESRLSDIEAYNRDLIVEYETDMGYR